jgi:hypothetical protein
MVALAALALGFAIEGRRSAKARHGAGYERARAIFAARQVRGAAGGYGTEEFWLVLGVGSAALLGTRLRRRFAGPG